MKIGNILEGATTIIWQEMSLRIGASSVSTMPSADALHVPTLPLHQDCRAAHSMQS